MPVLLGFILGVVPTIVGAYDYDASTEAALLRLVGERGQRPSADGQLECCQRRLAEFPDAVRIKAEKSGKRKVKEHSNRH